MRRLVPIILLALLLTACQWLRSPADQPQPQPARDFIREEWDSLPQEIKDWAENTRDMHLAHTKVQQGRRYILASLGERPSGGYEIKIQDVDIGQDKITVTVHHSSPQPDDSAPQVLTYPQDIVSVADLDLPIEYEATGDLEYIPTLVGIEELPTIQAQSPGIKVFSPAPGSTVSQSFSIEGVANVFEGNFSYLLRNADGTPGPEQSAMAGMGDWYHFRLELEAPAGLSQEYTLELFSYSARDGSVINLVEIPLKAEQAGD
jgi:hypothetical protein